MSWEILLFNSIEKINSSFDLDENKLIITDFDKILLENFSQHKIDNNYVEITGDNYLIDFFTDEEIVNKKMLSMYGENGLFEIVKVAIIHNWQIYDFGIDEFLDLENPSRNGHDSIDPYLNSILEE